MAISAIIIAFSIITPRVLIRKFSILWFTDGLTDRVYNNIEYILSLNVVLHYLRLGGAIFH